MAPSEIPLFMVRGGALVRRDAPRKYSQIVSSRETNKTVKGSIPPEELVYLWDVDGVEAGAANHEFYQKLERERLGLWIDPGCRNPEDAMDAFFAGAEVLTVRVDLMDEAKLADFADLAEYDFHIAVPFDRDHPAAPVTAWDLRRLVGELHAKGVVLEAMPTTDPNAFAKFVGLVRPGGIEVTLLSTDPVPWLPNVAKETFVDRLVQPWRAPA